MKPHCSDDIDPVHQIRKVTEVKNCGGTSLVRTFLIYKRKKKKGEKKVRYSC